MPSKGTPRQSFRIDPELWAQVRAQAKAEGINPSDLVRALLRGWLNTKEGTHER